jgi:hypothetical protein
MAHHDYRFALSYKTTAGSWIMLFNCSQAASRDIRRAQEDLGSTDFRLQKQGWGYDPRFIGEKAGCGDPMRPMNEDQVKAARAYVETH